MKRAVVLFHTTTSAIRAEKELNKAGLEVKLVPTPRELSSDCGIALQIEAGQAEAGARLLDRGKSGSGVALAGLSKEAPFCGASLNFICKNQAGFFAFAISSRTTAITAPMPSTITPSQLMERGNGSLRKRVSRKMPRMSSPPNNRL